MSTPDDRPAMYVGYLPLPWAHSRFLRWFIPLSLWAITGLAAIGAVGMRSPGPGSWGALATPAEPDTVTGVAVAEPYAMLITASGESVLVVEEGKFGAQDRFADLAGTTVTARGWMIEGRGRRMLEVLEVDSSSGSMGAPVITADPRRPDAVTLAGELMDGKCHLGVMKPGDGRGHRACAILCMRGGIPPLLQVTDEAGVQRLLLVHGPDGTRCPDEIVQRAGEPIQLTGRLGWIGDLPTLEVAGPTAVAAR